MTESHTFRDHECEAHKLVNFARLVEQKKKETREAEIDELLENWQSYFDSSVAAMQWDELRTDGIAMLVKATRLFIERAYLNAEILEAKTQRSIEKEAQRLAGIDEKETTNDGPTG